MTHAAQQYIDLYRDAEEMICRHSVPVLNAPRREAMEAFSRMGWPGSKHEAYRYTSLAPLMEPDFALNLNRLQMPANPQDAFRCDVPNLSTAIYFVVNDTPLPATHHLLPEGVLMGSLKELAAQHPDLVARYYGKLARWQEDAPTAFNTAFAQDGILLYVPHGVVVEKPIQLVNTLRSDVDFMANRRLLIILEEGAQARLLVCDHATAGSTYVSTQVTEAFIGEGAVFDLYELEETNTQTTRINNLYMKQEANSNVQLSTISLTGGHTRNTMEIALDGPGAELNLSGMAVADGEQHVDNHTTILHNAARCTSKELMKYVLNDEATGVFSGLVKVQPGAEKTLSEQTSRNLCATTKAHAYARPQLEIYADDVKCSHGATVGQLNEAALFYMRQRGISEAEARMMLMFAFVGEAIDTIRMEALRDRLHHLVEKRFRGELGQCKGCKLSV